jgi:hypothetical protein
LSFRPKSSDGFHQSIAQISDRLFGMAARQRSIVSIKQNSDIGQVLGQEIADPDLIGLAISP